MLSAPTDARYRRRSSGIAPVAVMWLSLGMCLGLIFWTLATVSLAEIRLERAEPLSLGWHVPTSEPEPLDFPAGIPFGTVLVREGDTVTAGQTLVALDDAALAAHADHVRRRVLAARYERRCLIDDLPAPLDLGPNGAGIDAETRAQLDAAALRCQTLTEGQENEATSLSDALESLRARLKTLDAKLALTFRETASLRPDQRASAALDLTLDRNRTETLIALQTAQRARLETAVIAARTDRIDDLTTRIGEDETFLAQLDSLRAKPRITAPADGLVTRVRSVPVGQVSQAPVTFAMVTPTADAGPELRAHLPIDIADAPKRGTPVELHLAGDSGTEPQIVTAHIARIAPVDAGEPKAGLFVIVEHDALADTLQPTGGRQILSAQVSYASVPLFQILWSSLREAARVTDRPGDPSQTL